MIACQPKNIVHGVICVWHVGLCHLGVCPHRDAAVHSVAGSSSLDWKEEWLYHLSDFYAANLSRGSSDPNKCVTPAAKTCVFEKLQ